MAVWYSKAAGFYSTQNLQIGMVKANSRPPNRPVFGLHRLLGVTSARRVIFLRYAVRRNIPTHLTHLALVLCAGCASNITDSAQSVADQFVRRYVVAADLNGAFDLSTGMAREKLKKEIALRSQIPFNAEPTKGRESLTFELDRSRQSSESRWTFQYSLRLGTQPARSFYVSTREASGRWLVTSYAFPDG